MDNKARVREMVKGGGIMRKRGISGWGGGGGRKVKHSQFNSHT